MSRSYEGSIYKTPDGKRYFARLRYTDASGKPREKKRVCVTHAKAKSMIDTLRSEIENEINERWTYQQLDAFYRKNYVHGAKFVGGIKVSGFKQNLNIISSYLDTALAHFNGRWIDEITFGDIENYKRLLANRPTIHGQTRSVADVNQNLRRLNRLFTVAIEQDRLNINPFKRGKRLITASHENERTCIATPAEEIRLLKACEIFRSHLIPIIIFAIDTAARKNEIFAVTLGGGRY